MQSKAKTISEYLNELSPERRKDIQTVRKTILDNLPKGYKEMMLYGMISYVVPLSMYPKGYGGNPNVPLCYVALASQKNYMSIYLMGTYSNPETDKWFRREYQKTGKKLDMGKGCVRFKKLADLPLQLIGQTIGLVSVKRFVEGYEKARS